MPDHSDPLVFDVSPVLPEPSQHTRDTFYRNATIIENGEHRMSAADFVKAITPEGEDYHKIKRDSYAILFLVADRAKKGSVSLQDWQFFEKLLEKSDAEYQIAFRLFNTSGDGRVTFDEFVSFYNDHKSPDALPFNWDCPWIKLYLGDKKARHALNYHMFSQMLRGLQGERIRQAFHYYDKKGSGFIDAVQFEHIIWDTARHKLSDKILDNLHTICAVINASKISYANVRAFLNLMNEMDMVDTIVNNACKKSTDGRITEKNFMDEAACTTKMGLFTPMEVAMLFHFASLDNDTGRLSVSDFKKVIDPAWQDARIRFKESSEAKIESAKNALHKPSAFLHEVFESIYHFGLGSVAGAFGATVVYPIDLVKTRMQNQRGNVPGQVLYKNSLDCFRKVIAREGFKGLYSGLGPQLIGVAPEKAIKLTVNDLVRGKSALKDGRVPLPFEILAGASAGACQVVFTNPLEIVKIRLQVQGELAKSVEGAPRRSALWIVRNLGLVGLYKGALACLLRDVPFSAIYFPTYAHLKKDYFGEGPEKSLGILQLLTAGAVAGMPSAYFTTPFDVIKTRLQVEARQGQTSYRGVSHCAKAILKEEGFKAFFKGGPARVLRSSPQFGCTLAMYELLQTMVPLPGRKTEAGYVVPSGEQPIRGEDGTDRIKYLRTRNALRVLLDIDENFGNPSRIIPPPQSKTWNLIPGLKKN